MIPASVIAWGDARRDPPAFVRRIVGAMRHPWIGNYAIGFGQPLTRVSPQVIAALEGKKAAFEKLDVYVRLALGDLDTQIELARRQVELVSRLHGPAATGSASDRSWQALDLELRLHHIESAPAQVAEQMIAAGLDRASFPAREKLESRLLIRLDDPFGAVLAHRLELSGQVIEHRVHPEAVLAWRAFAERQDPPLDRVIAV